MTDDDELGEVVITTTTSPAPSSRVVVRARHTSTGVEVSATGDGYLKTRESALGELRDAVRIWYANAC